MVDTNKIGTEPPPRELEALRCWNKLSERYGVAPSFGDLGKALKPPVSANYAHQLVLSLAERGLMSKPIPWRISKAGKEWL